MPHPLIVAPRALKRALSLAKQATTPYAGLRDEPVCLACIIVCAVYVSSPCLSRIAVMIQGDHVRRALHRSLRVWMLYVDLEESLGTFDSVRAVYDRILDLRIATPQIIINYALYLEENKYWEEAFKVCKSPTATCLADVPMSYFFYAAGVRARHRAVQVAVRV